MIYSEVVPVGVEVRSIILDFSTSWRRVVSFTPLQLYSRYPLHTRLGRP
jgi:hypothetical protein